MARCRLTRAGASSPLSRRAVPRNAWLAPAAGSSRTLSRSSDIACPRRRCTTGPRRGCNGRRLIPDADRGRWRCGWAAARSPC